MIDKNCQPRRGLIFVERILYKKSKCRRYDIKLSDEGVTNAMTSCNFINSESMGLPTSMMTYSLKKPIEIEGVLKKEKVKVVGEQDISFGTGSFGLYRYFEVENTVRRKIVPIEVSPALYNKGVRIAGDAFLKKCWDDFYSNAQ